MSLTDSGIKNTSIHDALVDLLAKPIAEPSAAVDPDRAVRPAGRCGANVARARSGGIRSSPFTNTSGLLDSRKLLIGLGDRVALRDRMYESARPFLQPGEPVQAVFGAQTHSQYLAAFSALLLFLPLNRYRMVVVTPYRILVLDTGKWSIKKAHGVVTQLPRPIRLGPGSGVWHVIPMGNGKLRVHRRFFKDIAAADHMAVG